jgi:hypothetical protein
LGLVDINEKEANGLLLKRLRYLTSNVRLLWRKKDIKSWIYYSNCLINRNESLVELDSYLFQKLLGLKNKFLKQRVMNISFNKGFYSKKFYLLKKKFTSSSEDQFKKIIKIWKHV